MMRNIEQKWRKLLILLTVDDKLNNYVDKKPCIASFFFRYVKYATSKLKGIFPLTAVGIYCNTVRKSEAYALRTRKQIGKLIE